mgnify:FL=1
MDSRKNTYFIKLIKSYSVLLIIILVLGIVFHLILSNNAKKELLNENLTSLQKVTEQFSDCYSNMYLIAKRLAGNSSLAHLAESAPGERAFYYNAYLAKQDLVDMYSDYPLKPIQAYYVYLHQSDYIIRYNDFEEFYSFYKYSLNFDTSKYSLWKNTLNSSDSHNRFIQLSDFSSEYASDKNNYCYSVSLQKYTFKNINADVIFEINNNSLQQIVNSVDLMKDGCMLIQNSEDETLLSFSNNSELMAKLSEIVPSQFLLNDTGYYYAVLDGCRVVILHAVAQTPNLDYYVVLPISSLQSPENSLQLLSLFIIFLGVIGSFVIIVLLSKANYKPYQAMEYRLREVNFNREELMRLNETQKITLRNYYFDQLIHGTILSEEEAAYAQNYLSISANANSFAILYCNVYLDTLELNNDPQGMINILSPDYADVISDILSSYFIHSYIMQGSRNSVYTILLYDREELDKVEDLFSHVHTTLLQEYNIWIYGGLGCTTDTISSVWKSYRQSKEAVKRVSSPVYLCLYREILEFQDSFFYPNEVTDQLYNFVKSGNFKQTKTIFNFIKDENFKKRKLNSRQVKWLLENIEITLLKVIRDNDISYDDSSLAGLSEDSTLENYEQIALELCEKNKQPENDNQLIVRIQAYIDENYGDPSLCLSRISDLFHISESYFSFLFKKTVGVNFSTYLEQIRMTQAKHLLETTNIKITDLYVAVGYNNLTSFRRAFKKKYGVAPNALRE